MGRHRRSDSDAGRAATGTTETYGAYPQGHDDLWDAYPQGHDFRDSYSPGHDFRDPYSPGHDFRDPYSPGHDLRDPYQHGSGLRDVYADDDRMGIAPYLNPDLYADAYAKAQEYLFTPDEPHARSADTVTFPAEGFFPGEGPRRGGGHRRRKKAAATPVRSGLLGVSAAVAIGTVAVATGAVPGLDNYKLGGGSSSGADAVQAAGAPTNSASEQGGTSGSAQDRTGDSSTSRGADRSAAPGQAASGSGSASASTSAAPSATPTGSPSVKPTTAAPSRTKQPKPSTPAHKPPKAEGRNQAPAAISQQAAAEAQVLKLVNEERAKVGCSPVTANSALTELAEKFSKAMADQDFFDHTDPSGASPWDRAAKLGITGLGGENIARGQADAAAVMEAWMNSAGHRANILNCDFKTLGVGVHFGSGGPWWTQDFGY
ncbi:CAP domain-containing protein [Streptomyces sp. NPDC096152]|uniref:CAP domain-containing protein n=1 Tax=Streptomyces sp. NPDC096152 TaxID=3366078 RepID=UPI0037F2940C